MKKHMDFVFDREGNAVVGAEVYVRKQSDSTLLSLFSDNGVTAQANPTTTDSDGEFSFWTANNDLKLQVYVGGVQQNEINNFQHYDLSIVTTFGWSLIDDTDAATARTTLGLGTISTQAASAVAITGGTITGITDLAVADGGTGASTAAAARTNLGLGTIATFDETTAAQYRNNTADKALSTDQVWAAAAGVALTPGTNVAVDLNSGINFTLAMGGNYTLDNPTNMKAGQTGCIEITQDGTGSRTLAYGTAWKFVGGSDPVLSTTASAKDLLLYQVLSDAASVYATLVKAIA